LDHDHLHLTVPGCSIKKKYDHKGHEEHEGGFAAKTVLLFFFVSFMLFVVHGNFWFFG